MQTARRTRRATTAARHGFTLVEILIVVIILGILAAIVIPQFTNASEDARKSSLTSQLQTIRSQIELYKLEHRGDFPTSDGSATGDWEWDRLTLKTDADGATGSGSFGPYLQAKPVNGIASGVEKPGDESKVTSSATALAPGDAAGGTGWAFDQTTGKFYACSRSGGFIYNEGDTSDAKNAQ